MHDLKLYDELGWMTIPLMGKKPLLKNWQRDPVPRDQWPDHDGVGIVTGKLSGNLLVIDVEAALAGDEIGMRRVKRSALHRNVAGMLEEAWEARATTPSGGLHLYFQADQPVGRNRILATADGVRLAETRGDGGQVAAPPGIGREWKTGAPLAVEVTSQELTELSDAFRAVNISSRISSAPSSDAEVLPFGMTEKWLSFFKGDSGRAAAALLRWDAGDGVEDPMLIAEVGFDEAAVELEAGNILRRK